MVRKYTIKQQPARITTTPAAVTKAVTGARHRHGCSICSATYEDSCPTPMTNGSCTQCKGIRPAPVYEQNLRAQECCTTAATPATNDDRVKYLLAGDSGWWLCRKCYRPHIYNPASNTTKENS